MTHTLTHGPILVSRDVHISMISITTSRERFQRCRTETLRRLNGIPLTSDEIKSDLRGVLTSMMYHLTEYNNNLSGILKSPNHAVIYCEQSTSYALSDYPKDYEDNKDIYGLWHALERIYTVARAWRVGEYRCKGDAVIAYIEKTAHDAMNYNYPRVGDDDTVLEEG
jgi:hypothetical protein